jgi:hypothetical protein
MNRKLCARWLALSGLMLALGCKSAPMGQPVITTPLLPDYAVPGPLPPPTPLSTAPAPIPQAVTAAPTKAPVLPPGAQLPKPGDLTPPSLPAPRLADLPPVKEPESAPAIVPPKDVAPLLASHPKAGDAGSDTHVLPSPKPVIKPLLVEPPRPPAGPDGFAPAPIIEPPTPPDTLPPPRIETRPPLPLQPGQTYGRGPDYRWLAGVLDKHTKGGFWTLRYADIGVDDEWGGKVRLMDDPRLRDLKDGDAVYIEGELMAPRSAATSEASGFPPYRVTSVQPLSR